MTSEQCASGLLKNIWMRGRGSFYDPAFWLSWMKGFLGQNVPDQVVFMQALHDQDDAVGSLVVESTVKRIVIPLIGGITQRL
jgi:hypothetical protein